MIRLALAQLRRRPGRYVSLLFAVVVAVALTVATAGIAASLSSTVSSMFAAPYRDADEVVTVRGGGDEMSHALEVACHVPGVSACAVDRVTQAAMRMEGGVYSSVFLQGIDAQPEQLQWRAIEDGRLAEGPDEAATTADVAALGQRVSVAVPGQDVDHEVTIVGHVEASAKERLMGAKTLFVAPATFEQWGVAAGSGEIRLAFGNTTSAERAAAVDTITAALPDATVTSAAEVSTKQADTYLAGRDRYFLLLTLFTVTVAAVAALVIVSAFSVVAGARRREFALLSSIGATAGQLGSSIAVEAALIGLLGGVLGAPAGVWAAQLAGRHAESFGIRVPLDDVSVPWPWLLIVAAAALVITVAAALPAARGAIRADVVSSLSAADASPRRHPAAVILATLLGLALLAVGVGIFAVTGAGTLGAGAKSIAAAVAAGAAIVAGVVVIVATWLPRLMSLTAPLARPLPTVQMGLAFVARQIGRAGAIAGIIVAGTALMAATMSGQALIGEHLDSKAQGQAAADVTITSLAGPLSNEVIDAVATTPGVEGTIAPPMAVLSLPGDTTPIDRAFVLSHDDAAPIFRGSGGANPGEIVLGSYSRLKNHAHDGQELTLDIMGVPTTGTVRFGAGPNTSIDPALIPELPAPLVEPNTLFTRVTGPAIQSANNEAVQAITSTLAASGQRVSMSERFSARQDILDSTQRILTLSTLLTLIAGLVAIVGVANTVILAVRERARDHALLTSIGVTRTGLKVALVVELVALALPAALLGTVAGAVSGTRIATTVTGRSLDQFSSLATFATGAGVLIVLATLLGIALVGLVVGSLSRTGRS